MRRRQLMKFLSGQFSLPVILKKLNIKVCHMLLFLDWAQTAELVFSEQSAKLQTQRFSTTVWLERCCMCFLREYQRDDSNIKPSLCMRWKHIGERNIASRLHHFSTRQKCVVISCPGRFTFGETALGTKRIGDSLVSCACLEASKHRKYLASLGT